jgi:hypothetical protein
MNNFNEKTVLLTSMSTDGENHDESCVGFNHINATLIHTSAEARQYGRFEPLNMNKISFLLWITLIITVSEYIF